MKEKKWCPGAGRLARLDAPPANLVTCPVCNRRGLNGEEPARQGFYGDADVRDEQGNWRYAVPRHQAKPTRPEDVRQAPMAPHDPFGREAEKRWCDSREWDR